MQTRPFVRVRAVAALAAVTALATVALGASVSIAQSWPARQIRIIVPLAAGGTADIVARVVGTELAKAVGQPVVIDNKPGAGGTIATTEMARAAPDGYTIGFASQGTLVFNQGLYAKPGYDSQKDFTPLGYTGGVSNIMVVAPSSPFREARDAIAAARAKPATITYSSGGSGTSHHMSGALLAHMTATALVHVPYKGAPQGILAAMTGEVAMGLYNTPTVINQIREGKLRALGVTSLTRSPLLPNVPTLDEAGIKGYEVVTWFGWVAPAGVSADIANRYNSEFARIMALPAVRDSMSAQGIDIAPPSPAAAFTQLIADELKKWLPIIKASGAKVD